MIIAGFIRLLRRFFTKTILWYIYNPKSGFKKLKDAIADFLG